MDNQSESYTGGSNNREVSGWTSREEEQEETTSRLLIMAIGVTMEKIQHITGPGLIEELIQLLHNEMFNVRVFKQMIRSREDCRSITESIISRCMERTTWRGATSE